MLFSRPQIFFQLGLDFLAGLVQRLLIRYVVPHHGCVLIAGVPVQKGLPIKNDAYAHGIQFSIYFGGDGLPLSSGVWRGFKHIQLYSA